MPGRWIVILVAMVVASMVTAVTGRAATEHAYLVSFPDDWVVEDLGSGVPLGSEAASVEPAIMLRLRAYPPDRSEECLIVDLQAVGAALFPLGVDDPMTMGRIAADVLDRSTDGTTSSSLGYGEPWSSWFKGESADGESYVLYTYLGRDAWPGLESEWLVLDCHSDRDFHLDWSLIARTFEFPPEEAQTPPSSGLRREVTTAGSLSPSPPPWLGGQRVEMPEAGFALTVPHDWVAFDATVDAISQLDAASGYVDPAVWSSDNVDSLAALSSKGAALYIADARKHSGCMVGLPPAAAPLPLKGLADRLADAYAASPAFDGVEPPERLDLPAGTAYVIRLYHGAGSEVDPWEPGSVYVLGRQDATVMLTCGMQGSCSEDGWLSIVESIEFLPEK